MRAGADDIRIYGGNCKAWEWFNWLWDTLHPDGISIPQEQEIIDLIRPLFEYVLACSFEKWAVLADVDMEPALIAKTDRIKELSSVPNEHLPTAFDVNSQLNVFDRETDLGNWCYELASRASYDVEQRHSGFHNDIIWMIGEKYPGSRPEFKESAFDICLDEMCSSAWFLYEPLFEGVKFDLFNRNVLDNLGWERFADDTSEITLEEASALPAQGTYLVVCRNDDELRYAGHSIFQMIACLDLLPDDAERFLVVCHPYLLDLTNKIAAVPGFHRYTPLYDDTGLFGDSLIASSDFEHVFQQDAVETTIIYRGELHDDFMELLQGIETAQALARMLESVMRVFNGYNNLEFGFVEARNELIPLLTANRYSGDSVVFPPFGIQGINTVITLADQRGLTCNSGIIGANDAELVEGIKWIWLNSLEPFFQFEKERGCSLAFMKEVIMQVREECGLEAQFDALDCGVPLDDIIGAVHCSF